MAEAAELKSVASHSRDGAVTSALATPQVQRDSPVLLSGRGGRDGNLACRSRSPCRHCWKAVPRTSLECYLSTILDDLSRYVIAWKLCTSMTSRDVTETLELALQASGCDQADVVQKPRLLSDNGSSYISSELADWITDNGMSHVRGAPYHPQTQGKIERWHQTLKNRILLEHYFLPGDLEKQIEAFVDHYNHQRYHESLKNLTPADVYFGRGQSILASRERIKKRTIAKRSLHYQQHAA